MNSVDKLKWRYATKKFDANKKLSNQKIDVLKEVFNLTATSYGLQPIKMLVISNQKIKDQLVAASYNQTQVQECSHLLVICIKTDIDTNYIDSKFDLEKEIRGTSEEIIGGFRGYLKNQFENMSNEDIDNASRKQAYIALGNLMTVCAFEAIDSCPMEGFQADEFDKILELNKYNLKSALLLPVGYRSEDDHMSTLAKVRFPLDDSIIEIQ